MGKVGIIMERKNEKSQQIECGEINNKKKFLDKF